MSQSGPHDEFLELCAASTTGKLSDDEQKRLEQHLAVCGSCREARRQYESIVSHVIPAIAAREAPENVPTTTGDWSQEKAEKALLDRLAREEKDRADRTDRQNGSSYFPHRILPFSSESTWRSSVWVEQEIAIAAFISQALQRPMRVRAYIHESIPREGLRSQLHLNPKSFIEDSEILKDLRSELPSWRSLVQPQHSEFELEPHG